MKANLKILIIDQDTLASIGLKIIIQDYWKNTEFLPESVIKGKSKERPDIIIMGTVAKRKVESLKQLRQIVHQFPASKILVLSPFEEGSYALIYLKSGARGYLPKSADQSNIIQAIKTVVEEGRIYCSEALKDQLFDHFLSSN